MSNYLECWTKVATTLFSQALAGEPTLNEGLPKPLGPGAFGYSITLVGDHEGKFSIVLDGGVLETPFLGDGADQKAGWAEVIKETVEAAAGDLLATTGAKSRVEGFEEIAGASQVSRAFQLKSAAGSWTILVRDETHPKKAEAPKPQPAAPPVAAQSAGHASAVPASVSPSVELLLDVELEATLRFGCRELPLGEILDLGPGDVVELDRHVADPVDLIVGDKIVARGEVVLVNGNFGLRVTEVAAPRKRLESIRCLF